MTNKEAIDRWAELIIPAVFKAEEALQKAKPEWKERLNRLGEPGGEDPQKGGGGVLHGDSDHHRDERQRLCARRQHLTIKT